MERRGSKEVKLASPGNFKGISLLVGGSASGEKLPLGFIFKGKKYGPKVVVPPPHKKYVTPKVHFLILHSDLRGL